MRLSDKDFFEKVIDRSIPELDHASRLFSCGKQVEAEKAFADFLKDRFPDERIRAFPRPWLESYGDISEEEYGILPWYIALMVRGDHRIEYNSFNRAGDRKREKERSDEGDENEQAEKKVYRYNPGHHFESPEVAYIRKETIREALSKLTDKQREVYVLYHRDGYTEEEIAGMLHISQQAVDYRLNGAEKKIRINLEKLF